MKHLYKLIIFFFILSFTGCVPDKGDTDYLNNRTINIFFSDDSANLLIEENVISKYTVVVGATTTVSNAASYSISVDPSSTAVEGIDFTISNASYTFDKGKIVSTFDVVGDFDNASIDGKTAVFNLSSSDETIEVQGQAQFTLNLIKFCPFGAGETFTGSYQLSTVDLGIFDTPTFTDGVVTVSLGATQTDRVFSVKPYPAFGSFPAMTFKFSLICGNVIVPGGQATNVGCGSSTTLGPRAEVGNYDPDDDSVFTIKLADDEGGASCGGEAAATIMLTKI